MTVTMVARGVLRPDGFIELLDPVDLPSEPRPVTVTVTDREATTVVPSTVAPRLPRNREASGPTSRSRLRSICPGRVLLDP